MFVPSQYRQPDSSWMLDIIRGNPLAQFVSNGSPEEGPFVTHLPVIQDPEWHGEWSNDLAGGRLLGHMNRANPHWKSLESGSVNLLTFTGPHGYVSPTVYEVTPAAPTWNFTSVHVHGIVEKIEGIDNTLEVVQATVRAYEKDFGAGWDMTESLEYFRKIVPAVGAFRIKVTGAEGMFKLSQEQPDEVQERVQRSFGDRECTRHQAAAQLMGKLP
ncbi:FMN-binding negative transcriptional regulator [Streptomyces aureocirculatus]|uniref:FMN-binding negative transcriptional regulator n=1 Tax=Streptomyces aureocirculatus TaxID=67275 RepID=UPI0004C7CB43|nr:FMN-binding negative transcriptional regulator [Streptomyces aureocirculatus]